MRIFDGSVSEESCTNCGFLSGEQGDQVRHYKERDIMIVICKVCRCRVSMYPIDVTAKRIREETGMCEYYPDAGDDPVCDQGSDISGTIKGGQECSAVYSLDCQWAKEGRARKEEKER